MDAGFPAISFSSNFKAKWDRTRSIPPRLARGPACRYYHPMSKCAACGAEVAEGLSLCYECGAPVANTGTKPAPQPGAQGDQSGPSALRPLSTSTETRAVKVFRGPSGRTSGTQKKQPRPATKNDLKYLGTGIALLCAYGLWQYGSQPQSKVYESKASEVRREQDYARQKAIVDDVKPLIEACEAINLRYDWGNERKPELELRGKALVWDISSDEQSTAQRRLPSRLQATSADSPITVFMVFRKRMTMVTYDGGRALAHRFYDIAVAYWPEKEAGGMFHVAGPDPPRILTLPVDPFRSDAELNALNRDLDIYPSEALADFIAALSRAKQASRK